jgi:hypothetical protein
VSLKKVWNCPVAEMVVRCGEIGVFDKDQVRRADLGLAADVEDLAGLPRGYFARSSMQNQTTLRLRP